MKPNNISITDLREWLEREDVTFASSTRERKRLTCSLNGHMRVTIAGKEVWQGTDALSAINKFNSITEKYIEEFKEFRI